MRIGILHTQIRGDEKLLINAARKQGIDVKLIDVRKELFDPSSFDYGIDAALERCVSSVKGLYAIRFFEDMGIPVVNNFDVATLCVDKFVTSMVLKKEGVAVVDFAMAFNEEQAKEAVKRLDGYPVVIKPTQGSWGRMLSKVNDGEALEGILEQKMFLGGPWHKAIYIQRYIEKNGRDIRSFVVDGKTVAAIYRDSSHWITNTARGGKASNCPITEELSTLGNRVSEVIGGGVLSIDLFETGKGLVVNEVNHTTEFKNSEEPTGVDISGKIIEYCVSLAGKPSRSLRT